MKQLRTTLCLIFALADITWFFKMGNIVNFTHAAPCFAETAMYGPPGVTITTNNWQWETIDDSTRLIEIHYCVMWSHGGTVLQHFRGWVATYESDSGIKTQLFGQVNAPGDFCATIAIDEEVMYAEIFSDTNDTEGWIFTGYLGTVWTFRANGADSSPVFRLGGRPIGFKVNEGVGGTGTADQPLQMAIVFNACNCPASSFIDTTAAPVDMETKAVSGPVVVEPLPYYDNYIEYIYDQDCGTYSVTLEPVYSFLSIQTTGTVGTSQWAHQYPDQITASSNDVGDIGKYSVTLRITQITANGDGYTSPVVGKMDDLTKEFEVIVNPCGETLTAGSVVNDMTYTIGDPTLQSSQYTWVKVCGYSVFVELTNLPAFVVHDETSGYITIFKTQDRETAGVYTVGIKGYVNEPVDYTFSAYNVKEVNYSFTMTIIDPCAATTLNTPGAVNMYTTIEGLFDEQYLTQATDSISLTNGDLTGRTYCGTRSFSIKSVTPVTPVYTEFLFLDSLTGSIVAQSSDVNHVGFYTVEIENTLDEFPTQAQTTTFTLQIDYCQVIDLSYTAEPLEIYVLYTPQITFSWEEFTQTPNCGHALEYSFELVSHSTGPPGIALPSWIAQPGTYDFAVYNTDPTIIGDWYISVTASVPLVFMNPTYSEELQIDLTVTNDCELDQVIPDTTLSNVQYKIDEDGLQQFAPSWTMTRLTNPGPLCPTTFEIGRMVSGIEQVLTAYELAVFSITTYTSTGGPIDLQTSDFALDGEIWSMKVYKRATYSIQLEQDGVYLFDITFIDGCWLATLTPSTAVQAFSDPSGPFQSIQPFLFDLWESEFINFDEMINDEYGTSCGGFTYELEYVSGQLTGTTIDPLATYTITQTDDLVNNEEMSGIPAEVEWLDNIYSPGIHEFRFSCTNGNTLLTRGISGLFNTVYSDPFVVELINPCLSSVVNNDGAFTVADISVPLYQVEEMSAPYSGPIDTISTKYGTGYDRCDEKLYTVLDHNQQSIPHVWLLIAVQPQTTRGDDVILVLFSEPEGQTIIKDIHIKVELALYPTATPSIVGPFKVTYRECKPDLLSVGPIEDQLYTLGWNMTALEYEFDQYPCEYAANFTAYQIVKGKEEDLPLFISQSFNESIMIYYTLNEEDVGEYEIIVYLGLDSEVGNVASTTFTLTVQQTPARISPNRIYEPRPPRLELQDQTLQIGQNMIYGIGEFFSTWGEPMDATVDMGLAANFVQWDATTNSFKVATGSYGVEDCGTYEICASISFNNGTYSEQYSDCYQLTINCPEVERYEPPFYQTSNIPVHDGGLELGPYNPAQPIPYIRDLSITGVLVIGWDRQMTQPEDFTVINPSKLGIRDEDAQKFNRTEDDPTVFSTPNDLSLHSITPENHNRRNLERGYDWFEKDEDYLEWLLVVDALELKLAPGENSNSAVLKLTWEMLNYSKETIWIQLYFEYPPRISENIEFDTLEVYFWGTEFFRSWEGEDVRFGTKLSRPIIRQIDPELAEWLGVAGHILSNLITCVVIPVTILTGRLLPTWMFINSLQLILHTPFFQVAYMPATVSYFFSQVLNIARFNIFPQIKWLDESGHLEEGAHNSNFKFYGYESVYLAWNLDHIAFFAIIIASLWVLALIKDTVRCFSGMGLRNIFLLYQHEAWMFNFGCRFVYEVFLELILCALISIEHPKDDFNASVAILIFCTVFIVYVLLLSRSFLLRYHRNEMSNGRFVIYKQQEQPTYEPDISSNIELESLDSITDSQYSGKQESSSPRKQLTMSPWVNHDTQEKLDTKEKLIDLEEDPIYIEDSGAGQGLEFFTLQGAREMANHEGQGFAAPITLQLKTPAPKPSSGMGRIGQSNTQKKDGGKPNPLYYEGGEPNHNLEAEPMKDGQMLRYFKKKRKKAWGRVESKPSEQRRMNTRYGSLAEWRVAMESEMQWERLEMEPRYKTFFYGHRLFSHSNAVLHSVLFLLRRAIFAVCLVYCGENGLAGIFFLQVSSLLMLMLLCERYWLDGLIVFQHVINELALYCMCVLLLLLTTDRYGGLRHHVEGSEHLQEVSTDIKSFSKDDFPIEEISKINKVSHVQIYGIGVCMIILLCNIMAFNIFIITIDAYQYLKLYWVRRNRIISYRRTRITSAKVTRITQEANANLAYMRQHYPKKQSDQGLDTENKVEIDEKVHTKEVTFNDQNMSQEKQNLTQSLRDTSDNFSQNQQQNPAQYLKLPNKHDKPDTRNQLKSASSVQNGQTDFVPVKTITYGYKGKTNQIVTRDDQEKPPMLNVVEEFKLNQHPQDTAQTKQLHYNNIGALKQMKLTIDPPEHIQSNDQFDQTNQYLQYLRNQQTQDTIPNSYITSPAAINTSARAPAAISTNARADAPKDKKEELRRINVRGN